MKYLLTLILTLFILSSCLMQDVSPVDEAAIISDQLTIQYINLYKQYKLLEEGDEITPALTGKNLASLKSLAPAINHVKELLSIYNSLVIQWRETGIEPTNIMHDRELITRILMTITTKILTLQGGLNEEG